MFLLKKIIVDKEYKLDTNYLDTKEVINNKLLDLIFKDILLEYNICQQEYIDNLFLDEIKKISRKYFSIDFFYENWNLDKTKYTVLVEIRFYESKLKYHSKRVILKRKNEMVLEELSQKDLKKWNIFLNLKKSIAEFFSNILEINGSGDIFKPWQSLSLKKIKKYSGLYNEEYLNKNYQKALVYLEKWLRHDRKNGEIYKLRGLIKEKLGDFIGSRDDYDKAITLGLGNDLYLSYYRGKVNEKMNILHEAKSDYKKFADYLKKVIISTEHIDFYLNNVKG